LQNPNIAQQGNHFSREAILNELKEDLIPATIQNNNLPAPVPVIQNQPVIIDNEIPSHYEIDESLNIMDKEKELILKALKKHKGRRKDASTDLGISERTLYRKIKEYDIEE
jgi:DNA-binding NtrC family response regulator